MTYIYDMMIKIINLLDGNVLFLEYYKPSFLFFLMYSKLE